MKYYAGIGSRETPENVLLLMKDIAAFLAKDNFVLRSGHAEGADYYFELGAISEGGGMEIIIPWDGFNKNNPAYHNPQKGYYAMDSFSSEIQKISMDYVYKYHPNPHRLSRPMVKLMQRNSLQVLGLDMNTPVKFVIAYTKNGEGGGGTGQAIRIARSNNLPIWDLGNDDVFQFMSNFIRSKPEV
jgi:hypothetical protein